MIMKTILRMKNIMTSLMFTMIISDDDDDDDTFRGT
jgi:hypothetical protein